MARGRIEKTKAGSYKIIVDVGKDPVTRKRKRHTETFRTKKEAEDAVNETIQQAAKQTYITPSKESFGDFMKMWLEEKKNQTRNNTWVSYDSYTRTHVIPALGHLKLLELTPLHLRNFYKALQERPLSARTIRHIHFMLRAALDTAVKWELIIKNVSDAVDPPRVKKVEMKVWDASQLNQFLKAAKDNRYYTAFFVAATTGMRQSELLGLRWKDVDLTNGTLSITQTLDKQTGIFQETKTDSSKRSIKVESETISRLKQHKADQAKEKLQAEDWTDHGLVICTSKGTPMSGDNLSARFRHIIKETGLPPLRFHDLRHTHATLLLKQGLNPKIVQERLGHSSISVTLDTYSHVTPNLQETAASAMSKILTNG
jgi:integrase